MSGYLGRIVRAEHKLHPLAGSVFGERDADAPPQEPGEPAGSVEDRSSAPADPPSRSPRPAAAREAADPSAPPEHREPRRAAEGDGKRLVAGQGAETRVDRESSRDATAAGPSRPEPSDAGRRAPRRVESGGPAPTVSRPARTRIAAPEAGAARAQGQPGARLPTLARAEPAPDEADQSGREPLPRSPARLEVQPPAQREGARPGTAPRLGRIEAGETHVHIGRIEVLAVPQPVPAPPSPGRERTTSLADYLAARSGRRR